MIDGESARKGGLECGTLLDAVVPRYALELVELAVSRYVLVLRKFSVSKYVLVLEEPLVELMYVLVLATLVALIVLAGMLRGQLGSEGYEWKILLERGLGKVVLEEELD